MLVLCLKGSHKRGFTHQDIWLEGARTSWLFLAVTGSTAPVLTWLVRFGSFFLRSGLLAGPESQI